MVRGLFLGGQLRPPSQSQGGVALADPNFAGSPLLMCTRLDLDNQIRRGNTNEEGLFLGGHPRNCICTSASRSLSATAEFLVQFWFGNAR